METNKTHLFFLTIISLIAFNFTACGGKKNNSNNPPPIGGPIPPGTGCCFGANQYKMGDAIGQVNEADLMLEMGIELIGDQTVYNQYPYTNGGFGYNQFNGQIFAQGVMHVVYSTVDLCHFSYGGYSFDALPPGMYNIVAISPGYYDWLTGNISGLEFEGYGNGRVIRMRLYDTFVMSATYPSTGQYIGGTFNYWLQGWSNLEILSVDGQAPWGNCTVSLYHNAF